NLTGLGITIDGTDAAMFTVSASPTAPVSGPSGTTTFTVRFAPTSSGAKTAALHLASNDATPNPFDIPLTGIGVAPAHLVVEQPAGSAVAQAGTRNFTSATVGSNSSLTFTIK